MEKQGTGLFFSYRHGRIYTFSNPYQLARTASGRFSSNEKSGPAVLSDHQRMGQDEGILQGFLKHHRSHRHGDDRTSKHNVPSR